jgi:protein gp37
MGDSKIEWTDKTWNPVRGCAIVSPGCRNCYAMRQAHRQSGPGGNYEGLTEGSKRGPVWTGSVRTVEELLDAPLRWKKPSMIFVNSMSDLFHDDVPDDFIVQVFDVIRESFNGYSARTGKLCATHTFQILTKRAARMQYFMERLVFDGERVTLGGKGLLLGPALKNVWLGVSVEDQDHAIARMPYLLNTPVAVRWLSIEPMLGPIDFYAVSDAWFAKGYTPWRNAPILTDIDWVVVGGESGYNARPMHPTWARSLREQCSIGGVPFFFKQWGEYFPGMNDGTQPPGDPSFRKVGKKAAGRHLDGRTHDAYPKAA